MPNQLVATIALVVTIGLAGCGSGSTTAKRDCFDVWNANSNQARQTSIAGRFTVAKRSAWTAKAFRCNVPPTIHGSWSPGSRQL